MSSLAAISPIAIEPPTYNSDPLVWIVRMPVGEDVKVNATEGGVCTRNRDVRTLSLVRKEDRILMMEANAHSWNGIKFEMC